MSLNRKCPRCGSDFVQLTNERSRHGCFFTLLFGVYYIIVVLFRWIIGLMLLICLDWWMAIIKTAAGKGYVWQCRKWFGSTKRVYYCHTCGYNFRA